MTATVEPDLHAAPSASDAPRSRRTLIAGSMAAAVAYVASAFGRPAPVEAVSYVLLGDVNTTGSVTFLSDSVTAPTGGAKTGVAPAGRSAPPASRAGVPVAVTPKALRRPAAEGPSNQGIPWTEAEDADLAQAWQAGEGLVALAARFGRSVSGVAARLVRIGEVETRDEARRRR